MDTVEGMSLWLLTDGLTLVASVYERYLGLHGQQRVGLVDNCGRVYHYDLDQIQEVVSDVNVSA